MRALNHTPAAVRVAFLFLLAAVTPALAGCPSPSGNGGGSPEGGSSGSPAPAASGGTGGGGATNKLTIEGSTTLLPLAQKWAEEFKAKNPSIDITVSGGGSGQGITSLINGTCDIADASRAAEEREKESAKAKGFELYETAVARDGITIAVHPSNPVKSLTLDQVKGIYTGKINNWKEVGGPDLKITTSGRDTASGTYAYFQEDVLKKEKYRADMISNNSNNGVANNVSTQTGAIGYIGVAYAAEFTKAGKIKEVPISFKQGDAPLLPTEDNILSGKYPISRALFNYTRSKPEGLAKQYLDYVTGPDGQKVVSDVGYVPLKK